VALSLLAAGCGSTDDKDDSAASTATPPAATSAAATTAAPAETTSPAPAASASGSASPTGDVLDREVGTDLKGKTICFGFQAIETEFWGAGVVSIKRSLEKAGAKVIEHNSNEDANKQLEQVKDCITQKVDGFIIVPQDGESAVTIIGEANKAGIPIGIFNRPPADDSNPALVAVADNRSISKQAMEHMAGEAKKLGRKVQPLIMVGDLGDPNAVERRKGFYDVIDANPDLFEKPIEVETKWDHATALANLTSAMQKNNKIDVLFGSTDAQYPQIKQVLESHNRWKKIGEEGHVIIGAVDGDNRACNLMREKYVDATGVQDLFREADDVMKSLAEAIKNGEKTPGKRLVDPGFALTQANFAEKEKDMWGCVIDPPKTSQ
jgi:inositol transport system substrate-binding protein